MATNLWRYRIIEWTEQGTGGIRSVALILEDLRKQCGAQFGSSVHVQPNIERDASYRHKAVNPSAAIPIAPQYRHIADRLEPPSLI